MPDISPLPTGWQPIIDRVAAIPGVVMTLGAPDSGKTTWVRSAVSRLGAKDCLPLGVVDSDLGQTSIGPPATVALGLIQEQPREGISLKALSALALSFVGSVSPRGHLLPTLVACARLAENAKHLGARVVLVDTSGFIASGPGFQLKLRKIELLNPRHLIAFQSQRELEPLLSVVDKRKGLHIHRLDIAPSVRRRTPEERSSYRAQRFSDYFADSEMLSLPLKDCTILSPPIRHGRPHFESDVLMDSRRLTERGLRGLLIGLNTGENETLGLGLFEEVEEEQGRLWMRTPVRTQEASIQILQFSSLRLSPSWHEVDLSHERF